MWKKLQLKTSSLLILNQPECFDSFTAEIAATHSIHSSLSKKGKECDFILTFATAKNQLIPLVKHLKGHTAADPTVWMAYLKMSSKKYDKKSSDLGRDKGYEELSALDFEPVSAVSINDDWSALRFRKVQNIGEMTRQFAKTETGKAKVAASKAGQLKKRNLDSVIDASDVAPVVTKSKRKSGSSVVTAAAIPSKKTKPARKKDT